MSVPLIGCGSHKFNLAVQRWMKEQPHLIAIIAKVAAVMKKASTLKVAAKLKELTRYCVVKSNEMRWSSTYNMVGRYFLIQPQLSVLVELLELLPTPIEVDTLSRGFRCLKKFDAITILLQRDGIPAFVEIRNIFDVLFVDFPEMKHNFGEDSSLVVDKNFERGVMGISKGLPLTVHQHTAVVNVVKAEEHGHGDVTRASNQTPPPRAQQDDDDENYAVRVLKRLKMQALENIGRDRYVNLDVIPGTSVNCERLFSLAKHVLTDTRKTL